MEIPIPGWDKPLTPKHLVMDYNGTLACDGTLIRNVKERLFKLSQKIKLHVVTADTFGKAQAELVGVPCKTHILAGKDQVLEKQQYVNSLGSTETVAIGNGFNDQLMLQVAALAIAVILEEGAAMKALQSADIVCRDICEALDLLIHPPRLQATLRK